MDGLSFIAFCLWFTLGTLFGGFVVYFGILISEHFNA